MNDYKKPKTFDRNLIVIGAGSAGLVAAYIASMVRAKVTLIEKHLMGGDCLNTGCVPSKALIRSAKILAQSKRAGEFGFKRIDVDFDFADVMQRIKRVIKTIEPHDSMQRYTQLGVECIQGEAHIVSPYAVAVNGRTLTTRNIIIAAGARPFIPPIPGIEAMNYLTSDTIWGLTGLPKRLVVLGGGPIGSELTQCFARFGSEVTQIEMLPRILIREDPEVSERIKQKLEEEGVRVLVAHTARRFRKDGERKIIVCERDGEEIEIEFDALLVAVGRKPAIQGLGLEDLQIPTSGPGTLQTNKYLQTVYPNIFACGDVAGPYQFTHTAAHQAWYACVNALFGSLWKFKVDYSVIPWATFTDPEVARVGLNETEAQAAGIKYEVSKYDISDLDRAITDEEAQGFVKVLTVPGKDRVLGASIVGDHAAELITEYISAMRHGLGMTKILGTIHIYPTLSEANKSTAGIWKKAHTSAGLLQVIEWFLRFQRG